MRRDELMQKAIGTLALLPDDKLQEVADFSEFLLSKTEDRLLVKRIQTLVCGSDAFRFLEDEEDLYSEDDLKKVFK